MSLFSFIKTCLSTNNFDNYPDAVILIDSAHNIIEWNCKAVEIFGRSKQEITGRNIAIILDLEEEKLYSAAQTGEVLVTPSKNDSDKDIFVEVSCTKIKDKLLITARDVTKKQKIIEQLILEYEKSLRISRNKNAFILGLSGDFKTPVHSLLGFSQGLLDGVCGQLNEKQGKYVSIMHKNANGLLDLLDDFLELSRLENEEESTNMRVFDLMGCINDVCDKAKAKIERKGLRFNTDVEGLAKKNIYSDEDVLAKILTTVMDNAVNFTETGAIKLKLSHPEVELVRIKGIGVPEGCTNKSYIEFSITDMGAGIAKDDIQGIFDEYSPANRNIAKKYGGTGLRLALAGRMVERLGGVIYAESEVGQGSVFSFIIPVERPRKLEENRGEENKVEEIVPEAEADEPATELELGSDPDEPTESEQETD